ncbi:MAG: hypothetical protein HYU60_04110 [Magnetospirillum sp.]|nr:hypothetical protein [Magnetospirillum sp.]
MTEGGQRSGRDDRASGPEGEGLEADRAWVAVDTPLPPAELLALTAGPERLFRVNPLIEYREWTILDGGRLRLAGRNHANGRDFDVEAVTEPLPHGLRLRFADGLKQSTALTVEESAAGARLMVVDDYRPLPVHEREARLAEVDSSLLPWGQALHPFLARWHRWRHVPGWRWLMDWWLTMTPSSRRICRLVAWVTLGEFVVFLFVAAIWSIEQGG